MVVCLFAVNNSGKIFIFGSLTEGRGASKLDIDGLEIKEERVTEK